MLELSKAFMTWHLSSGRIDLQFVIPRQVSMRSIAD